MQTYQLVASIYELQMFDQLLGQLEDAITTTKSLKGPSKSSRNESFGSQQWGCDPTKTHGQVMSFGKSQRFKVMQKQQLKLEQVEWQASKQEVVGTSTGFSFRKGDRFEIDKQKYNQTYINPNYSAVKKNISNNVPIYKPPQPKDLSKSGVSVSTVASESFRGPGRYTPTQDKKMTNVAFSKDKRFRQQKKKYEDTPLLINQNQTRKKPPTCAVMKKKIKPTSQLISKQQQEDLRQTLKLVYWKNVPLQLDRLFKNNSGPVIRENYFDLTRLTGTRRRAALFMMMGRLNYMRGGFEQDIRTSTEAPCGVAYRKSTPKPFVFSQMEPGPDYYSPLDDMVRPSQGGYTFARAGIQEKIEPKDFRDYDVSAEIMKKGGNIVINPVHSQHRLTQAQIKSLERGPGFYDCLFGQVEKRDDIGVIRFPQLTQKNDRQNNCVQIKQVCDGIYFPSYKAMDPNIPAPLYKEKADVKPPNLPEKQLFPQHWLFYDGDLKKLRAEIAKNVLLAKGMSFSEYKQYATKFQCFKDFLQQKKKQPQVGQYSVEYTAIDPHMQAVQFSKQPEKTLIQPIVKQQGEVDGDNLILQPTQLKDHLPNIDFKKMAGRQTEDIDPYGQAKEGDILVLNPRPIQKHVPTVDFAKQEARAQPNNLNGQSPQGDVLILHPQPVQKHIAKVEFSKQADRPQIKVQQDQNQQILVVNPAAEPKIKGVGFSRLSSVRMVPILRQRSRQKQKPQSQAIGDNNQSVRQQ